MFIKSVTNAEEAVILEVKGILQNQQKYEDLISTAEAALTGLVQENYQAVLFICEPDGGTPRQFYTVPGQLAGELTADEEGHLLWQTEDIQAVGYSPATNAFAFYGTSEHCEYRFSSDGVLESRRETEEMVPFRK